VRCHTTYIHTYIHTFHIVYMHVLTPPTPIGIDISTFISLSTHATVHVDNANFCQDEHELAIIQQEGSPSGPLLQGVNQIASSIEAEFPDVMVETLACATPPFRHATISLVDPIISMHACMHACSQKSALTYMHLHIH
jgi:hypothetical protein